MIHTNDIYKVWQDQILQQHGHGQPQEGHGKGGRGCGGVDDYHYVGEIIVSVVARVVMIPMASFFPDAASFYSAGTSS